MSQHFEFCLSSRKEAGSPAGPGQKKWSPNRKNQKVVSGRFASDQLRITLPAINVEPDRGVLEDPSPFKGTISRTSGSMSKGVGG